MYIPKREEIQRRRLEAGLNKQQLSIKAGLPSNALSRIEKLESRQVQSLRAKAIAKALHCKVGDIFHESKGE